MPAVWNRHERCGAYRANFARTGTDSLRMSQLRVCDQRAVGGHLGALRKRQVAPLRVTASYKRRGCNVVTAARDQIVGLKGPDSIRLRSPRDALLLK